METQEIVNEIIATARNQKWSVKKIVKGYGVDEKQAIEVLKEIKQYLHRKNIA
jgi:uncharacterized protein (DUF433 family)